MATSSGNGVHGTGRAALALLALALGACQGGPGASQPVWTADLGNGQYQNPVLHADYSDPDAIRVGDRYYMTASSFSNTPGLPLLRSSDMVNWELVGHALPTLVPESVFATPQPGKGVWAPCLRFHDGQFWIFYPDPDFGIYVISATSFDGPWTAPRLLAGGKGLIDPTPLWDDDGQAYLLHGWAKSRAGFNNVLTLRRMAPDASRLLDAAGQVVIDGNRLANYTTLEGPKFYKKDGYYYVFAPAGGVEQGWQSVFRSRSIGGPYEDRIVMAQGRSGINGPHQGAWVTAQDGSDWFFHFQDKRAYGRVLHLQPMRWRDGWPLIGEQVDASGVGQPFARHAKPLAAGPLRVPPSGDEFSGARLGLQWQWSANGNPAWFSLAARPGYLRLPAQAGGNLRQMASVLTQKLPAPAFTVDTRIELASTRHGDRAGMVLLGMRYAWLGLRRAEAGSQLVLGVCEGNEQACTEKDQLVLPLPGNAAYLRMRMADGVARFSYSLDQRNFVDVGAPFKAGMGRWVGAQMGLFSAGGEQAYADVDYFRVSR
jgi:beta-xylosidase